MTDALTLVRLQPDMVRLARWARASGLRDAADDPGYALHAATRAALGSLAPKPFALRQRAGQAELVGYTAAHPDELARAAALDNHDPEATAALRLHDLLAKPMPQDWRAGERFSFEVRVAPVVRSRARAEGAYVEIDAAYHPDLASTPGDRVAAYAAWLRAQLARGGAAEWLGHETVSFHLTDMVRRTQAGAAPRHGRRGRLPDLTVRGSLRVGDGAAFGALLARGLGRHRAFGFGCLLLAPPGAFHRSG
ncbi:MAG: type I-E CRISPR-associated protein Cas6/Cse3/CasE [Burkholderiaceae bacterium]|nr:type I-E CRISPR-associated protein Cas6/Cse3/CasE [Burkholderiaceae bacterium]